MLNLNETETTDENFKAMDASNDSDKTTTEPSFSESYKQKQRERISSYKVGNNDLAGNKITKIYSRGDEYIIYEIGDHPSHESMRVNIDSEIEDDMTKIYLFQDCKVHFDEFVATCYKYNCASIYKKRAATILSSIILGRVKLDSNPFQTIISEIKTDYDSTMSGRNLYQLGAIALSLTIILISIAAYLLRETNFLLQNHFLPILLYVSAFASMGGFISVSLKIKTLHTDRELKKKVYFFYGAERILFSVIGGILVFFMLKGNMIFGFLNTESDISFSLYVICALSGFSETLIPNTLRNLESKSESQGQN
ncbi:hypothetical protein [Pantoea ananatis]|uniref:hypothetical protein n=1 Tax=Pantoea ananas TaxID=553 RepID=UPI001F11D260|nr:hypothetical protein [Pantoea ananatis]